MAGRRANGVKFGRRGLCLYTCIWGTFDLLLFKVIWGLYGALVSKCVWHIAEKTVPEFENKKSVYENIPLWYDVRNMGVVQERMSATSGTFDNGQVLRQLWQF